MRNAFIKSLCECAAQDPRIMLLCADVGFSVVEPFAQQFPERYLNVGVSEQNMTGVAAGLALEGSVVFTYSIANFPTLRCIEQIRYDLAYHRLNVKVVAVGGGYAYGAAGPSHHATEEIGMLRTIPNLAVCSPADPFEAAEITRLAASSDGPCYIRLNKAGEASITQNAQQLSWGQLHSITNGVGTAVISCGAITQTARDFLADHKLPWGLYSCPFIKPLDAGGLIKIAMHYDRLITLEEHQRSAGFGSAILEGLHDLLETGKLAKLPSIKRIAIPDSFIEVAGSQQYLRERVGLTLKAAL
ncbi:MAG: transketolase [Oligoflexia bacterium]|nr:transketolase [Oligoflexia bacterium]